MHSYVGEVRADDVVWLSAPFRLARFRLAIKDAADNFHCVVTVFARNGVGAWLAQESETVVVPIASVYAICSSVVVDGKVFV